MTNISILDKMKRSKILDLLQEGKRIDDRALDEPRPLVIDTGVIHMLMALHGLGWVIQKLYRESKFSLIDLFLIWVTRGSLSAQQKFFH